MGQQSGSNLNVTLQNQRADTAPEFKMLVQAHETL